VTARGSLKVTETTITGWRIVNLERAPAIIDGFKPGNSQLRCS
jgi:hypothetical protein